MAQEPIVFKSWRDLPLINASLGDTTVNKTGSWRNVEPHHVEQIPPCSHRCPAGNDVVGFVTLAAEGRFEEAWRVLAQTSPFPGTCGRVCPHPCETECNRDSLGGKINIHTVERFLGDLFRERPPEMTVAKPTNKRIAVIGSGPAGLSAAYHLVLAGHSVTVFEAHAKAGGMLRVGIPDYRLPAEVLDGEIARIRNLGVEILTETRVGKDVSFDKLMEKFDAIFTGTGLTVSRPLGIKGESRQPSAVDGINADGESRQPSAVDGMSADGESRQPSAVDGISADGESRQPSAVDGISADGESRQPSAVDGISADGESRQPSAVDGISDENSCQPQRVDSFGVVSGTELLRRVNLGLPDGLGERVLVVGGGNTAMDAARSLLRPGKQVSVMYRRTRNEMPAITEEIDELLDEGIPIEFLATPVEVLHDRVSGQLVGAKCVRMQLGKPDESGRRKPEPIPGSEFVVNADNIVTAIGETADLSYLPQELLAKTSWNIPADELGRTFEPKLFAGGDVADGAGTVTAAIGFGRKAAIAIDAYLGGASFPTASGGDEGGVSDAAISPSLRARQNHVVRFEELNTAYFDSRERLESMHLPVNERTKSFDEVRGGFDEIEVVNEARRCFSCGTCPACDNCFIFCPDVAVHRMENGKGKMENEAGEPALYWVDYEYCKGCGLCAAECPRACILMKAVH